MPITIQKEIITELKESQDFDNVVVGTYGYSPNFFEDIILRIFQQKDAKRIMVLIDPQHYEDTFQTARSAGVLYLMEPISHENLFHPKFIFMTAEDAARLLIGSANITENGFIRDGEVFTVIDYEQAKEYPIILSVFAEMRDFLISLTQNGYVRSEKHKEKILESLSVSWLSKAARSNNSYREIRILHNLNTGILPQLNHILKGNKVERIAILSPFFDSKGKVINYLASNFAGKIGLYIQPDRVCNFPVDTIKTLIRKGKEISVFSVSFKNAPNRFIHAKMILIETNKGNYCLTGSANATVDGLIVNSATGNVELCLLRYDKNKKSFEYLFNNSELTCKRIDVKLLKPNLSVPRTTLPYPDIYLEEARIEGNNLIVQFSPPLKEGYSQATLTISRPVSIKPIVIEQTVTKKSQVIVGLSEDVKRYCEQSAYVTLTLSRGSSKSVLLSNKRWISTQVLDSTPRKREINLIEKSHGRIGLITLLNQLDKASDISTMLLYYLQFLDFDWLEESLERTRRRIVRKSIDEEGLEDEIVVSDRFVLTAKEVLEIILAKHEQKFDKLIENVEKTKDLDEQVQRIFDLFLFLNKIVIWFILRKDADLSKISGIIHRMKLLVGTRKRFWYSQNALGYFDKIQELLGRKKFLALYENMDVLPHFILLSHIILKLAEKQSDKRKLILEKQLSNILRNTCVTNNKKKEIAELPKDKMEKVIAEYKEYEDFVFSLKALRKQAVRLVRKTSRQGPCQKCKKQTQYRISSDQYLCPHCARKQVENGEANLVLMRCVKCGFLEWQPAAKTRYLMFCKRDSMRMEMIRSKFYVPTFA